MGSCGSTESSVIPDAVRYYINMGRPVEFQGGSAWLVVYPPTCENISSAIADAALAFVEKTHSADLAITLMGNKTTQTTMITIETAKGVRMCMPAIEQSRLCGTRLIAELPFIVPCPGVNGTLTIAPRAADTAKLCALLTAIFSEMSDEDTAALVLTYDGDVNYHLPDVFQGCTPLIAALRMLKAHTVHALAMRGCDPQLRCGWSVLPLHYVLHSNDHALFIQIIKKEFPSVDLGASMNNGTTNLLHTLIERGTSVETIQTLVKFGCDIYTPIGPLFKRYTALERAERHNRLLIAEYLRTATVSILAPVCV